MKETLVASRYAKSLLGLAIEQSKLEEAFADMKLVAKTCNENRDFSLLLKSPIVKSDKKQSILTAIFGTKLSELGSAFVAIIVRKKREYLLEEIASEFVKQYKKHKHIVTAKVTSVVKLDDAMKARIVKLVSSNEGEGVELIEVIDPSIIGGFIVRVGDKEVDASIIGRLADLKQEFSKNEYVPEI
jgi:F-type H+-transporting ATPase subunit delta